MAATQMTLPVRLDIFEPDGRKVADDFMVLLQRNHGVVVVLDAVLPAGRTRGTAPR